VRLVIDRSARVLADGTIVVGGRPTRLLRLTSAGGRLVEGWRAGAPVGDQPTAVRLAARLVSAGLAHPIPADEGVWRTDDVAVVIPARDRAELLAECLARVAGAREVIVVDDGSRDPRAIAAVAEPAGARVIRHPEMRGPAAARNTGVAATSAPLVAFVDSDTRPEPGWLEPLLPHFTDPGLAAVGPRIVVPLGRGALAAYEAVRSPLDLGDAPGIVAPGHRVGFIPAAALVVRRDALVSLDGFDDAMRFGEDVDLVWRLAAAGWTVRYEPASRVLHPCRSRPAAWLGQRVAYGSSAAPLAGRHPGQMRHLVVPTSALAPWLLIAAGRPRTALLAAAASTAVLAARLPAVPGARRQMLAIAAHAQLRAAQQLLDAAWRAYPPVVIVAATRSRGVRRAAPVALSVSIAADWITRRPRLDPVRFGVLRAADDLAYATGVWLGCLRAGTIGPLVPGLAGGRTRRVSGRPGGLRGGWRGLRTARPGGRSA
jgi:mycofactocin system glycosyltransferase